MVSQWKGRLPKVVSKLLAMVSVENARLNYRQSVMNPCDLAKVPIGCFPAMEVDQEAMLSNVAANDALQTDRQCQETPGHRPDCCSWHDWAHVGVGYYQGGHPDPEDASVVHRILDERGWEVREHCY
jgi:hypothetical protein